jgi:hypothetical protein
MKTKLYWVTALLALVLFSGCKKEAGVGGDATVYGTIWTRHYNSTFTTFIGEYPAEDQYVYIIYGDHPGFDDRVKTSYDGTFQFEHLYKGDYKIYTYSLDSTLTDLNETVPVIKDVQVNERDESIDLGRIIIFE